MRVIRDKAITGSWIAFEGSVRLPRVARAPYSRPKPISVDGISTKDKNELATVADLKYPDERDEALHYSETMDRN
ncbi:hypothetical protein R1flu_014738 [Riccia fluitans]|uniref:Uncharacterized protein n=1 Tax=Riccia fluitans TaxID=41844 RepID=A0ABD1YKR9_9MARC